MNQPAIKSSNPKSRAEDVFHHLASVAQAGGKCPTVLEIADKLGASTQTIYTALAFLKERNALVFEVSDDNRERAAILPSLGIRTGFGPIKAISRRALTLVEDEAAVTTEPTVPCWRCGARGMCGCKGREWGI